MNGKVTVTKAVADAISCGLGIYGESKETFIREHSKDPRGYVGGGWSALNGVPLDTLIRVLYVGYEIEKSPADAIRERYEYLRSVGGMFAQAAADEIVKTLDTLGEKVSGVNL